MPNIKRNWNKVAGKRKQKYPNLTDDDLLFKEGKEEGTATHSLLVVERARIINH